LFSSSGALLTTFTNPNHAYSAGGWFGTAVASVGGDRVLIGASRDSFSALQGGRAYLFRTNGALLATFEESSPQEFGEFGDAVAAVGADMVLIGAPGEFGQAGAAYLGDTNGNLLGTFTSPFPAGAEYFGDAVAAVGTDKVIIGAPGSIKGAAYLFWVGGPLLTVYTNPTPVAGDAFGISLAGVDADKVLIGAPGKDAGATNAGAAYLFSTDGTLLMSFVDPLPTINGNFGSSVAALGTDRLLISANGNGAGVAYLFSTNGTLLLTLTNPTPASGDAFGSAVAAFGPDKVLIGDVMDDTGATNSGSAYLFTVSESYMPGFISGGVANGSITVSSLADGAVTGTKLAAGAVMSNSIANGQVVRRVNGLADHVTLAAGPNVTITPSGNTLQIAAVASTNGVAAWGLTGNSNTLAGVNFLGTTDNQPLELVVNNRRALRLEPALNSPNVIGGYSGNYVGSNVFGATIGGGGSPPIFPVFVSFPNVVNASYGSILGGYGNTVAGYAATVAGGRYNSAEGDYSFAAGRDAHALHEGSFVWADATSEALSTTASNQFLVRATGGVGINWQSLQRYGYSLAVGGDAYFTGDLEAHGRIVSENSIIADQSVIAYKIQGTVIDGDLVEAGEVLGGYLSAGSAGLQVWGDAKVHGDLDVSGLKLAAVETSQGRRGLHAEESAQAWFTDYGFGRLERGRATIQVDPLFSETVNLNEPYHVFVQPTDPECEGVAVINKTPTSFEVVELRKGKSSAQFSYRLVALRRGYEKFRLDPVPAAKGPSGKRTTR
jgi:hypothetical protein